MGISKIARTSGKILATPLQSVFYNTVPLKTFSWFLFKQIASISRNEIKQPAYWLITQKS